MQFHTLKRGQARLSNKRSFDGCPLITIGFFVRLEYAEILLSRPIGRYGIA